MPAKCRLVPLLHGKQWESSGVQIPRLPDSLLVVSGLLASLEAVPPFHGVEVSRADCLAGKS